MLLASIELTKLLNQGNQPALGVASKLLILGSAYVLSFFILQEAIQLQWILLLIPLIFLFFIYELFTTQQNQFKYITEMMFGFLYVFIPFMSLIVLATNKDFPTKMEMLNGRYILLGYFIILWTSDSMAYVTGKLLGKHKIAPAISPGKTWEGVIGGFVFSLVAGFLISYFTESSRYLWTGMAVIVSLFGFLGDLSESMLKRKAGLKDSGNILPGHGGILDRFDGIVFSAPLVMCYLFWI
jgi:phosphatidate cytidylyltransferase